LLLNKNLLKEITAEAQSLTKVTNDEDHDSEGCSSSEEDIEPPTSANAKKAIEVILEEVSPERLNPETSSTIAGDSPLVTSR
jgi:hypothetical protein